MISLHVYMTPKANKQIELETGIKDKWIAAMSKQPGFLKAVLLKPFPDNILNELNASKPISACEIVSFWESEAKRQEWVARPIHDQVFNPLLDLTDKVSYTLQTIEHNWNL